MFGVLIHSAQGSRILKFFQTHSGAKFYAETLIQEGAGVADIYAEKPDDAATPWCI